MAPVTGASGAAGEVDPLSLRFEGEKPPMTDAEAREAAKQIDVDKTLKNIRNGPVDQFGQHTEDQTTHATVTIEQAKNHNMHGGDIDYTGTVDELWRGGVLFKDPELAHQRNILKQAAASGDTDAAAKLSKLDKGIVDEAEHNEKPKAEGGDGVKPSSDTDHGINERKKEHDAMMLGFATRLAIEPSDGRPTGAPPGGDPPKTPNGKAPAKT